jgi:hypothetical protein
MKIAPRLIFAAILGLSFFFSKAQVCDSIYLMNGNVVGEKVLDTLLGAITVNDSKKPGKKIHYEWDQLYMVKFANGTDRYYYQQDTAKYNWLTLEEMWMFMKGENDARRGFKPKACAIAAGVCGLIGGMSGTFWGPVLPYGYMAFSGITKIKIRANSVSDARFVDYDGYILGYERVARNKRKIWSVIGGSIGLVAGYGIYAAFHNKYPENLQIKFLNINL